MDAFWIIKSSSLLFGTKLARNKKENHRNSFMLFLSSNSFMGSFLEFMFSNPPIYFLQILFILFFARFFEAHSKESIDGAAD